MLAAVADEAQCLVGSALERVWEPEPGAVCLGLYRESERWLTLCASPGRTRACMLSSRPKSPKPTGTLALALLRKLEGATLTSVSMRGDDRILDLWFDQEGSTWVLVAELTGRMPNLLLLDRARAVYSALRWVGPARSLRPVVPKSPYAPPPGAPPLPAAPGPRARLDRPSPFALRLEEAGVDVRSAWDSGAWSPCLAPGLGAYPLPLEALGIRATRRPSISQALEAHFADSQESDLLERTRGSLLGQLRRALLAREVALRDVREAQSAGTRARDTQTDAELLLTFAGSVPSGASEVELPGYDGIARRIRLDPAEDAVANAQRLFAKAKSAKARLSGMAELAARFAADVEELEALSASAETADGPGLSAILDRAKERGWFHERSAPRPREERPFDGHAVRETVSPGGWRVLYGENATANDYLTTKASRPRDLWFHVRGAPSAHVVLATDNQPHRVQRADILFAARLAVERSPLKHSGYVSVDYTERRYVRKPRGSAPGMASYTNEKTVHVER